MNKWEKKLLQIKKIIDDKTSVLLKIKENYQKQEKKNTKYNI